MGKTANSIFRWLVAAAAALLTALACMPAALAATYTITVDPNQPQVATGDVRNYHTLSAALSGIGFDNTATITLMSDITESGTQANAILGQQVTVDLNGHTITVTNGTSEAYLTCRGSRASITISNGKIVLARGVTRRAIDQSNDTTLTLEGVTFSGFSYGQQGGAVFVSGRENNGMKTTTIIKGCTFTGNSSNNLGGALYAENDANLQVSGTTFENNTGVVGAVCLRNIPESAPATFSDCTFKDNAGTTAGGAMRIMYSSANFDGCSFEGNSTSVGTGGAAWITSGKLEFGNCTFTNNTAKSPNNEEHRGLGGALCIDDTQESAVSTKLDGCTFTGNTADINGGAVYVVLQGALESPTEISNCTFTGNEAVSGGAIYMDAVNPNEAPAFTSPVTISNTNFTENKAAHSGGGLTLRRLGFDITGCDISNNRIDFGAYEEPDFYRDTDNGRGGGLWFHCTREFDGHSYLHLTDTTFDGNQVVPAGSNKDGRGGGLWLWNNASEDSITFSNVKITNNSAPIGGGIDYSMHNQTPLVLYNALVTQNTSVRGGGIWICPTGSSEQGSTLGGVILGNTATGDSYTGVLGNELGAAGDDIDHEGSDSKDIPQYDSVGTVTVTDRTPTGEHIAWYADSDEERYASGAQQQAIADYQSRGTSFWLHGQAEGSEWTEDSFDYNVVIKGNTASVRGGGIATNSPVDFGLPEADKTVRVKKEFDAGTRTDVQQPNTVLVDLVRIANGQETVVEEGVELNAAGGWEHTFENLPAYSVAADGTQTNYTYTVREQALDDWEEDVDARQETTEGLVTSIAIINKPKPKPTDPVSVVVEKHLVDAFIHAEEFSFGLYDEEGTLQDTVHTTLGTHTAPSTDEYSSYVEITFKDLVFKEAGTYNYTIREHMDGTTQVVEGDELNQQGFEPGYYKGGVKYDDKEYSVRIVVAPGADDKLVATVAYPDSEGNEAAELHNEYDEEYTGIDGQDSHADDGKHEDEQPTPQPQDEEPQEPSPQQEDNSQEGTQQTSQEPGRETVKQPASSATPKAAASSAPKATPKGTAKTADAVPVAGLVALLALGGVGLAASRRLVK